VLNKKQYLKVFNSGKLNSTDLCITMVAIRVFAGVLRPEHLHRFGYNSKEMSDGSQIVLHLG
jgi:hypothetical protein